MDRIYMNRIEGQRRIHVEIHENEVSDLLDDLKTGPEPFAATHAFLDVLRIAEETFSPAVAEGRRDRAARQASGQQPDNEPAVAYRSPNRPNVLLCREHGKGSIGWGGLVPLTADDQPDEQPVDTVPTYGEYL